MRLQAFPNCCTAKILIGLGPSATAGEGWPHNEPCTKENFFKIGKELLLEAGRGFSATVIAITNSDQLIAIETLPALGFIRVQQDIGKRNHADKTLSTWVYTVCDKDRQPLPIPANPFVVKKEAPVAPVPIQHAHARNIMGVGDVRAGIRALMEGPAPANQIRTIVLPHGCYEVPAASDWDAQKLRSYLAIYERRNVNQRLRGSPELRRAANGRFRRLPAAGKLYTLEETEQLYTPNDMRYVAWRADGIVDTAYRQTQGRTGLSSQNARQTAAFFMFA